MSIKTNIVIDQGSDFTKTLDIRDDSGNTIDLTDYSVASQMRKNYATNTAVTFTATTTGANSQVIISLTKTTTNTLEPGRYLYDIEITSAANTTTRPIEGIATVTPGMTRV